MAEYVDDRKKRILKTIIEDYIQNAEPVGSRRVSKNSKMGLSSATVRNEMADLEDMGYLTQPYTSAGRIPTEKGYRMYVDELMKLEILSREDLDRIQKALELKIDKLSQLIRNASFIMSKITNYTSVSMMKQTGNTKIKAIQIVPIEEHKALAIVVTYSGEARNNLVNLPQKVAPEELIRVSNMLCGLLKGKKLDDFNRGLLKKLEKEIRIDTVTLATILEGVAEGIYQIENPEVHTAGTSNIFNYPEFMDVIKAKKFLSLMDQEKELKDLFEKAKKDKGITVLIGSENELDKIEGLSLIRATYRFNDVSIGSIGILGPTRMDYSKVISSMSIVKKAINSELKNIFGEDITIE